MLSSGQSPSSMTTFHLKRMSLTKPHTHTHTHSLSAFHNATHTTRTHTLNSQQTHSTLSTHTHSTDQACAHSPSSHTHTHTHTGTLTYIVPQALRQGVQQAPQPRCPQGAGSLSRMGDTLASSPASERAVSRVKTSGQLLCNTSISNIFVCDIHFGARVQEKRNIVLRPVVRRLPGAHGSVLVQKCGVCVSNTYVLPRSACVDAIIATVPSL
jgi:hypothetical protein